jgi:DNA-binding Lrp family transcriptional regulator
MGGVEGFIVLVPEGSEEKVELLLKSLQPAILGVTIQNCSNQEIADKLSVTDYRLIKQLIYNPRMQISELGKSISASSKTVRRRLDVINDHLHILEFTILPNPNAMKGQIIFFLFIRVEKPMYNLVLETVFGKLCNHIIFSLITYDQEKETIGLNLATEDVFKLETMRSEIQSLEGVKEVNVFFPIKVQYHEETVAKAIDRQIMRKHINVSMKNKR